MVTILALLGVAAVLFVAAVLATRDGEVMADAPRDAADLRLPEEPLTSADVGSLRFSMAARGYRMSEVDLALERLARELADRDRRIALLEAAAEGHEKPVGAREATVEDLPAPPSAAPEPAPVAAPLPPVASPPVGSRPPVADAPVPPAPTAPAGPSSVTLPPPAPSSVVPPAPAAPVAPTPEPQSLDQPDERPDPVEVSLAEASLDEPGPLPPADLGTALLEDPSPSDERPPTS